MSSIPFGVAPPELFFRLCLLCGLAGSKLVNATTNIAIAKSKPTKITKRKMKLARKQIPIASTSWLGATLALTGLDRVVYNKDAMIVEGVINFGWLTVSGSS